MNQKLGIDSFWDDLARIRSALPTAQNVSGVSGLTIHTHADATQGGPLVIGTTDSGATQGSVLFAGAAGVLQEDNANFFWDDANDYLGIGLAIPAAHLEINAATATDKALIIQSTDDDTTNRLTEWQASGGGVVAYVDPVGNAWFDAHGSFGGAGVITTNRIVLARETMTNTSGTIYGLQSQLNFDPSGNFTTTAYGIDGLVTVGTAFTQTGANISGIRARVEVDNNVAATLNSVRGFTMLVDVEDATASQAAGAWIVTPRVDTGLATSGWGMRVTQGTVGAGSITTLKGIEVDSITAGGTNWALYTNTGDSRFGDAVHFADFLYHDGDLNTYISFTTDAIDIQAGGVQFLTIVEDGVQDILTINDAGADVDFLVKASGVADALEVQGSDGQITLGALGTGLVKSTAGVLSIAVGTDVPAHDILSAQHGDTSAAAVSQGSLIYGDATPDWAELVHPGGAGYALVTTATTVGWDQTPSWTGLHSFAAGITFNGGSGANNITIPDNVALAVELEDAGGLEYLRIVSTDAQPIINFNSGAADVDFHVEASGVADALQVQGSDGQITLGVLGAGFVQSDAGGVLSSAAIVAGDLPSHTHSGAGQGGSLVVGTTDTDATAGSVFFAGVAGVIQQDNASLFWDDGNNRLGILTATPSSSLHIDNADSVTTGLRFDNTGGENLTQYFSGAGANAVFLITYGGTGGAEIELQDDGDVILAQAGNVGINTTTPDYTLDVNGQVGVNDFIYHNGDIDTYWQFNAPDQAQIVCGGATMMQAVEGATDYVNFLPSGGIVFVDDTANTFMTNGVTVNQQSATNECLTLKTAVANAQHDFTVLTEADSYGTFLMHNSSWGGLKIRGFRADSSGAENGLALAMQAQLSEAADTTYSTAGIGVASISAFIDDGAGDRGTMTSGGNLLSIRTDRGAGIVTVAIITEEGDIHLDAAGGLGNNVITGAAILGYNTYDDHGAQGDLDLLHGFRASLAPDGHELKRRFAQQMETAKDVLARTGVVTYNEDGSHFVAMKQGFFFLSDVVRMVGTAAFEEIAQLRETCASQSERLTQLERKLLEAS